jgi:hypothetical protein
VTRERYFQWMRIWKWFAMDASPLGLGNLHNLLNHIWQDERQNSTAEQLAEHLSAWALEDISDLASDPEYQAFIREMEKGET